MSRLMSHISKVVGRRCSAPGGAKPVRPTSRLATGLQGGLILLFALLCFGFFQGCYANHLFYQEQNQLFLLSADYLRTYFHKPAWLACLLGDFLTQFYYYVYMGPLILTVALLVVGDLSRRAFQGCGLRRSLAFALTLAVMVVEAFCAMHTGFRLSSVIALAGGLAVGLFFLSVCRFSSVVKPLCSVVLLPLTHWLFGYGAAVLVVLCCLEALLNARKTTWKPVVATVVCLPLLLWGELLLTNERYVLLTSDNMTYPGVGRPVWPETALERELRVANLYYFGHHDRVVSEVEQMDAPTAYSLFFYNLVQARRGELADHLMSQREANLGTFYAIGPDTPLFVDKMMNELYWELGDMTFTERAAQMALVFSREGRNVRMVKRLAEANLVSGDTLAARKYLRLLEHTWAYADWARQAPNNPLYVQKRKFVNRKDTVVTSDNAHQLMMQLLDSNGQNTVALDYLLCSDLLLKDIENFKRDYDRYCGVTPRRKPLYQQALLIWLAGTQAGEEEWRHYISMPEVAAQFRQYSRRRGDPAFRDTYWYYFDRAKAPEVK